MAASSNVRRPIHEGWAFTQIGGGEGTRDGEWLETASFPTSVHVELVRLKRIPDPFLGLHEWDVQCELDCDRDTSASDVDVLL